MIVSNLDDIFTLGPAFLGWWQAGACQSGGPQAPLLKNSVIIQPLRAMAMNQGAVLLNS